MNTLKIIKKLLAKNSGIVRTADVVRAGISRTVLCNLVKDGQLERIAHGRYIRPDDMPDELYLLQQRSAQIIFSHETALYLHNMAERTPLCHVFTIPSNRRVSASLSDGCKIYYVKPEYYNLGQCTVKSKMGNVLRVYNVERTICDILRSRSRIDSQTFAAAVKNYAAYKKQDWNKLRKYAEIFRVGNILRQYLEVLT